MPTTRTKVELEMLRVEAERLVRAGESRADVARRLDVSAQTLAAWALKYRWRQMDLEAERAGELARAAAEKIGAMRGASAAAEAAPLATLEGATLEGAPLEGAPLEGALPEWAPPEEEAEDVDPGEAARRAMGRANSLIRRGRVAEADRTLRLAERFLVAQARMDRHVQRMGEGGAAAPAPGQRRPDETEGEFQARKAEGMREVEHIC